MRPLGKNITTRSLHITSITRLIICAGESTSTSVTCTKLPGIFCTPQKKWYYLCQSIGLVQRGHTVICRTNAFLKAYVNYLFPLIDRCLLYLHSKQITHGYNTIPRLRFRSIRFHLDSKHTEYVRCESGYIVIVTFTITSLYKLSSEFLFQSLLANENICMILLCNGCCVIKVVTVSYYMSSDK